MDNLRRPTWVFIVNTIPVVVFLALSAGEFSVVHTLLPPSSVALWQLYGGVLVLLGSGAAAYAAWQWKRGQPLSGWYSAGQLLAYSLFLCLLTTQANELLPPSVPRWMVPTDPVVVAWTFLMPTLAHSLLALVAKFTPDDRPQYVGTNVVFAMMVLMSTVVVFWLLALLTSSGPWSRFTTVLSVAFVVVSTLSFFFFLVRALFIITQRKAGVWTEFSLVWKITITLVLPLAGLALNNGVFFGGGFGKQEGIFGNFSSLWFYGLAALNAALLCLPDSPRPALRLLQLLGRSALFGYTFYFFLVFLPFLPLAIPAIILIGTGFLLLAPLLLFVVHARQLTDDVAALNVVYPKSLVRAVLLGGLLVLPLFITASFWYRRQVLHAALAYVYTPDYAKPAQVDAAALSATLAEVRQNKERNADFMFGSQQPYLSTFFNWLVLDNLMLSDQKLGDLERIFSGPKTAGPLEASAEVSASETTARFDPSAPQLQAVTSSSVYDARQQAWVSWVNLEIASPSPQLQNGEYSTAFRLPEGCWVSDYYLTIGNRQERGILAEKKAATWVFAQIVNENSSRDPGLVSYRGPHEIAVRVYPVSGREVRRTRIQFLHKEPCTLLIDGRTVNLRNAAAAPPVVAPITVPGTGITYLSSRAKQRLPLVQRRPYYHFLLDVSRGQPTPVAAYQARIERHLARALPNGTTPRFTLVNSTSRVVAAANWVAELRNATPAGGYFLTGAMQRVLFEAQQHPTPSYPVLVAVTDHLPGAVLESSFEAFSTAFPESEVFYVLGPDGQMRPHSLRQDARSPLASAPLPGAPVPVRAWPSAAKPCAYLSANEAASIVVDQRPAVPAAETAPANRWLSGLLLRGYGQWQNFHPETTDQERVPFIQASFRAGIMTPFTSFLALENEAQKAALRRKQAQTLAANSSLDTMENEEAQTTAVPIDHGAALLLVAGVLLAGWYLRRPFPVAR